MWRNIKKIIHHHTFFLLTTHVNPDGDGIGSACALTELLLHMNKSVRFVCDGPIPPRFKFLDYRGTHEIYDPDNNYSTVEVIIVLDAHQKERIGRVAQLMDDPSKPIVCIDHHMAKEKLTPWEVIDPKACSVGAMIYTLCKECGFELNCEAAMGIYASVICDTGRFSYSSTSRKAHKIADECIKLGVDPDEMYTRLFQNVSLDQAVLFARALQRMETYFDRRVVFEMLAKEDFEVLDNPELDIEHFDLEYIHNFNKLIEDIECVVLLSDLPQGRVRISMRSNSDLNVGKMMRDFGGGGHQKAAGASCKGTIEETKMKILSQLDAYYRSHPFESNHVEAVG